MSNLKKIAAAAIRDVETERDAQDALQDENGRWHSERDGRFVKTSVADAEFKRRLEATVNFSNYIDMAGNRQKTRVFFCTGKPICEEFERAINDLLGGKHVSDADLSALPEIKYAHLEKERIKKEFEDRHGVSNPARVMSAERERIRENVFKKWHDGEYDKGRRIDVVMGVPASGKSTLIVDGLIRKHGSRLCDSDDIKKDLPEYGNGLGADLVKDEANMINGKAIMMAARRGENIVYPIIGQDEKIVKMIIETAKSAGYSVHLHFAKADRRIAKGRLLNRFVRTGRLTELDFFEKAIDESERTFRKAAKLADSATLTETYMKGI